MEIKIFLVICFCLLTCLIIAINHNHNREEETRSINFSVDFSVIKVLENVIDKEERRQIMEFAPNVKWTTVRHASHPTTDIPVASIWWLDMLMFQKLKNIIMPQIAKVYAVDFDHLWLRDMFLVKYDENGQKKLGLHRDASAFSFIIQVNSLSEFEGGGTYIQSSNNIYRIDEGNCLIFAGGKELHAGVELKKGKRFIITGFVDYHPDLTDLRRQYLMYNLHYLVVRKKFNAISFHRKKPQAV